MLQRTYVVIRRLLIFVIGISILLVGVVMVVTPGPAIVVIPVGLAVLATEFVWARAVLDWLKRRIAERTGNRTGKAKARREQDHVPPRAR